jgi:hypothetical protein
VLLSGLSEFGIYVSLGESALFILGTAIFVLGQTKVRQELPEQTTQARYSHAK